MTALIAVIMQVTGPSARADFNLASLSGGYADGASGFSSITNQPAHTISAYEPVSGVGLWTFDGNGNVTANLVLKWWPRRPSELHRYLHRECEWYRHHQLGVIWDTEKAHLRNWRWRESS